MVVAEDVYLFANILQISIRFHNEISTLQLFSLKMSSCTSSSEDETGCNEEDFIFCDESDTDDDKDSVTSNSSNGYEHNDDKDHSGDEDYEDKDEDGQHDGDEDGGIRQSRQRLSEFYRTQINFSDDNICSLINKCRCKRTRLSDECGNDYECANTLGTILQAKELIRKFRTQFWTYSEDQKTGCITRRRFAILRELQTLYLETDGVKSIDYKIAERRVCKNVFFEASAVSERMCNDSVAYVLGLRTSDDMAKFFNKRNIADGSKAMVNVPKKLIDHCSDESSQHVVNFLNH